MKARVLTLMVAAAALALPARAVAAGALDQAHGVSSDAANFDGGRARPEGDLVREGSPTDRRTAAQIARDEQAKADARANLTAPTPGPDKEIEPPKPNEWLKSDHLIMGVKGAMVGLLVGSLWGLTGLGLGVLVGGLIGYALSRIMA
ncbi:MAG: hypothetical protein PHS14_10165 [Elusimicrobia bacterium]|nr:hypothetical protein [Elusimicrobiota bacterium]